MKHSRFSELISRFFTDYLRKQRGVSENTIETYAYSLQTFIEYLKSIGILEKNITLCHLKKEIVIKYLNWLEDYKKNSIRTRNLRLAVIHTLCDYIINQNIEYLDQCTDILKIKFKKEIKKQKRYIEMKDIKLLLSKPDTTTKKGIRDVALISLLYDSGCRVSEFIEIKVKDIDFKRNTISLLGKGRKQREIPISSNVNSIILKYIRAFDLQNNDYLFMNSRLKKLTRPGITYIINKYTNECRKENKDFFQGTITPHILRRSKATHILEFDINIYYIRDFLGHESVQTTEMYVRTNINILQKAIIERTDKLELNKKNEIKQDDLVITSILDRFK